MSNEEVGGRTSHQVYIGPEFFAKEKRGYSNWTSACVRELLQNCNDAPGSKNITLVARVVGGETQLVASNDGAPMDRDTLINKFFALGGSTKNGVGTVGGMGVAKVIIAFSHKAYQIRTGNMLVKGSGAAYTIEEAAEEYFHGTETIVTFIEKDTSLVLNLLAAANRLVEQSSMTQQVTVNGKVIAKRLDKGKYRKDMTFGQVFTNDNASTKNQLIVRAGGMPMFTDYVDYKGTVTIDLTKPSTEVLTANRDGLQYQFRNELGKFASDLAGNKAMALQPTSVTQRFKLPGYKLVGKMPLRFPKQKFAETVVYNVKAALAADNGIDIFDLIERFEQQDAWLEADYLRAMQDKEATRRPEFFIKNETGFPLPADYTPATFCVYASRLIDRWTKLLRTLAGMYKSDMPFAVGFIFTNDGTEAEYEEYNGDRILYIKPATVSAGAFKAKWSMGADGMWDIVAAAAHEFAHYNWGITSHNEEYAIHLTNVMAACLRERAELNKIFASPVEW